MRRVPIRAPHLGLGRDGARRHYCSTDDDGYTTSQTNRALAGGVSQTTALIDPAGAFVNGLDTSDGRVGFGATASVSPNGRYTFVAGGTAVGVDAEERLYVSIDGADFLIVEDAADALNALRAAGVAASNNVVAFLIPTGENTSDVSIGYATLPPQ